MHGRWWWWRSVYVRAWVFLRGAVWEDGEDGHWASAISGFAVPDAGPGQTWEYRSVPVEAPGVSLKYNLHWVLCLIIVTHACMCSVDKITLTDLKRCRMAHIFFDTFFNLEKYLDHEQRDRSICCAKGISPTAAKIWFKLHYIVDEYRYIENYYTLQQQKCILCSVKFSLSPFHSHNMPKSTCFKDNITLYLCKKNIFENVSLDLQSCSIRCTFTVLVSQY